MAKKSASKKKPTVKKAESQALGVSVNLMSENGQDLVSRIPALMDKLANKRKRKTLGFSSLESQRADFLAVPHFTLQYLLGTFGLPKRAITELIGRESLGKSTFCYLLAGYMVRQHCPTIMIHTQSKSPPFSRMRRALSYSFAEAQEIAKRIFVTSDVFNLEMLESTVFDMTNVIRGRAGAKDEAIYFPLEQTGLCLIDSWTSLLPSNEAEGVVSYKLKSETDKEKNKPWDPKADKAEGSLRAAGEGSNMGHAKWAHAFFKRRSPALLHNNNMVLVVVSDQNDKVDMSGGGSYMEESAADSYNTTTRGGRALASQAAVRLVFSRMGQHKRGDKVIGKKVKIRCVKNSFGVENRCITMNLINEHTTDSADFQEMAIDLDSALADLFVEHGLFETTVSAKRYTSTKLGVHGVSAAELATAFHLNKHAMLEAGKFFQIEGYFSFVPGDPVAVPDPLEGLKAQRSTMAGSAMVLYDPEFLDDDEDAAVED